MTSVSSLILPFSSFFSPLFQYLSALACSLLCPLLLASRACVHSVEGHGLDEAALWGCFPLHETGTTESRGLPVEGV